MENSILQEYYEKFKEFPPIIMTANYNDENYEKAMIYAITKNIKLTNENIKHFFKNNYDLIDNED